jgi:alpha-beta hydrolase superfamily lysophospholipase
MIRYGATAGRRVRPCRAFAIGASLIAAALLLVACALQAGEPRQLASLRTPHPADRPMPRFSDAGFLTTDGQILPARQWLPHGRVKAVILGLHGFNDYSNAFAMPAAEWAARGIATYAYDQRGFGGTPERTRWAGRATLAADAASAVAALRSAYPQVPIYLLGESMGGAVAVVVMTGESGIPIPPVDGVVLSAPAVWARSTMPFLPRLALWAGARLFPSMTLTGKQLHLMPSDNIPMLRALSRDPMVIKETRVDTIYGLVNLMDAALAAAPALSQPTLLMYGAHDEIVPAQPIRDFVAALPARAGRTRRLAYYRHGYHMLLRDLDGTMVADDVASWVLHGTAGLPSGADRAESLSVWPPRRRSG